MGLDPLSLHKGTWRVFTQSSDRRHSKGGGGAKTAPPDVRLLHNTLPLCVSGMWKCEGQHSSDCVTLCESPKQQTGESPEGFEEVSSPPVEKARWLGPEDNPSA